MGVEDEVGVEREYILIDPSEQAIARSSSERGSRHVGRLAGSC